jgi:SAM-dependent methyltransferase
MVHFLRRLVPAPLRRARHRLRSRRIDREFRDLSPETAFTRIYHGGRWGRGEGFHSGWGSYEPLVVDGYVERVGEFLTGLGHQPDVVDLGCGDFSVGARLRPFCARYVACDVVAELIEHDRDRYRSLGVDFRRLDLTRDELPLGEVALIRQVLQHLTNDQIGGFLANVRRAGYRHLVVTEELPRHPGFIPNLDKPIGPGIRIGRPAPDSGVVLTAPPFDLEVRSERVLWQADAEFGIVRTTVYELP